MKSSISSGIFGDMRHPTRFLLHHFPHWGSAPQPRDAILYNLQIPTDLGARSTGRPHNPCGARRMARMTASAIQATSS